MFTNSKRSERLFLVGYNKKGLRMTIIEYFNTNNLTVRFDDGVVVKNRTWKSFKQGSIAHPDAYTIVGETNIANNELEMKIIDGNSRNCTIQFEDGVIVYNKSYTRFKTGNIGHPTVKSAIPKRTVKVGYSFRNKEGQTVTIVNRVGNNYKVRFNNYLRKDLVPFEKINESLVYYPIKNIDKKGYKGIAYNGIPFEVIDYIDAKNVLVKFADGIERSFEWSQIYKSGKIRQVLISDIICGHINEGFMFRLAEKDKVFYLCKCVKCGKRDILTPNQMLEHKCIKEGVS